MAAIKSLDIFPWNKSFETGITLIDDQHKKIIDLLNVMVSHLAVQSDAPSIDKIFAEIKDYVQYHFAAEEEIWRAHFGGDVWLTWHHQSHEDFIAKVIHLKEVGSDRPYDEVLLEIVRYLTEWLARHILDADKRMAKVVLALPSGVSLSLAKEAANEEMAGSTKLLIETLMFMYNKLADSTLVMSREIYKRQVVEQELLFAKAAAESANVAKSMFLASMSHELRTPLNAILGFSDLLRRDAGVTPAQKEILAVIHRSGDHLLGLINDVLEIAKIEAGSTVVQEAPFDLNAMLLDITNMLRIRAHEKHLQLLLDQSSQFPRYIVSDEAKLRQILINLITNAIKATEQGGVSLRLGVKHNHSEHLLIEVEDTGCGIAPEDQAKLMRPFVQVGQQNKQQGTGLGLSISHRFVEMMGGSLTFTSTPGRGSVFRLDLPVGLARLEDVPLAPKLHSEVVTLAPDQPTCRVLVVEDHWDNRMLLVRLLESVGFQVKSAENGAVAVEQFAAWQPHFIWMDRRMPIMDGVEAARHIRLLPGGDKVKIAAVTASTFKEEDLELTAAGFQDIVHKPFRNREIFECMERLLGLSFVRETEGDETVSAMLPEFATAALAALPLALRERLAEEMSLMDSDRIMAVVEEVKAVHADLAEALRKQVRSYDYRPILALLNAVPTTGVKFDPSAQERES